MLRKGIAVITPMGIEFMAKFYSCRTALHLNWFEKAARDGSWEVVIYYAPINLNCIYLHSTKEHAINCIAYRLNKSNMKMKQKIEYYRRFNTLKKRRDSRTSKFSLI